MAGSSRGGYAVLSWMLISIIALVFIVSILICDPGARRDIFRPGYSMFDCLAWLGIATAFQKIDIQSLGAINKTFAIIAGCAVMFPAMLVSLRYQHRWWSVQRVTERQ